MKLLLLILFSSLTINISFSQSENFELDDGQVIWRKVINSDLTKTQLLTNISQSGHFINVLEVGENVTAQVDQLIIDYEGNGWSYLSTPIEIIQSYIKCFVIIEFKEDRYRVTLKNILFVRNEESKTGGIGELTLLESVALRRNNTEFKNSFLQKPSEIMNLTFERITSFNEPTAKDKW